MVRTGRELILAASQLKFPPRGRSSHKVTRQPFRVRTWLVGVIEVIQSVIARAGNDELMHCRAVTGLEGNDS